MQLRYRLLFVCVPLVFIFSSMLIMSVSAQRASREPDREAAMEMLGLLNDSIKDEALETFARDFAIDYPIIPMDDDLYRAFDAPDKLPITLVYDKSGHLRFGEPGALNLAELAHIVDPLLAE